MTPCRITFIDVPSTRSPFDRPAQPAQLLYCKDHGHYVIATRDGLCQIGVVEHAVETGLAKIADATQAAVARARAPVADSTLARAEEIEADFYELKAQEWALAQGDAKERIMSALHSVKLHIMQSRLPKDAPQEAEASAYTKIARDLAWRGPIGQRHGHVALSREEAEQLLAERFDRILGILPPIIVSRSANVDDWTLERLLEKLIYGQAFDESKAYHIFVYVHDGIRTAELRAFK